MKRAGIVIMSFFYLLITIGFAVQIHFCSGEIRQVRFFAEDVPCCGAGDDCESGCCRSESRTILFEQDTVCPPVFKPAYTQPVLVLFDMDPPVVAQSVTERKARYLHPSSFLPPGEPAWLMNCSLVFYG